MGRPIQEIEGIGPAYAEKLGAAGIDTTEALLEKGATSAGREALAEQTGLSGKLILEWVNMADLCRIKGIGGEYAELLEAAGVDTVKELRTRNADNLSAKLAEVNEQKKLVRQVPPPSSVADWITQAGELPPKVEH
jgi:predicted flap endonuclease-1-like 5' DNA nuclease